MNFIEAYAVGFEGTSEMSSPVKSGKRSYRELITVAKYASLFNWLNEWYRYLSLQLNSSIPGDDFAIGFDDSRDSSITSSQPGTD